MRKSKSLSLLEVLNMIHQCYCLVGGCQGVAMQLQVSNFLFIATWLLGHCQMIKMKSKVCHYWKQFQVLNMLPQCDSVVSGYHGVARRNIGVLLCYVVARTLLGDQSPTC